MTIRNRLLLTTLALLLIVGLAIFVLLRQFEGELVRGLGSTAQATAAGLSEEIDRDIFRRIEALREFAQTDPLVQRLLAEAEEAWVAMESSEAVEAEIASRDREWTETPPEVFIPLMESLLGDPVSEVLRTKQEYFRERYGYEVFGEIFLTDRRGVNVAQTSRTSDYLQSDEEWWQISRQEVISVEDVELDESAGIFAVNIGIRVDDEQGEPAGVMKAVLNIEEVKRILVAFHQREEGELGASASDLRDRAGELIFAAGDPKLRPDIEGAEVDDGNDRIPRPEGGEVLRAWSRSRGFEDFPGLGWSVSVYFDAEEALAPVNQLRRNLLKVGSVALLLVSFVGLALGFSITRPVERAAVAADRLAKGEFGFEVKTDASGEMGRLLRGIKTMMTNTRASIGGVLNTSGRLGIASERLVGVSRDIAEGSRDQAKASRETSTSMEEMATSIGQVAASTGRVSEIVDETLATVEEMARSNELVAESARGLAVAVDETVGTVGEMSGLIGRVEANATKVRTATDAAVKTAAAGGAEVDLTVAAMQRIAETMDGIVTVTRRLEDTGAKVSRVVQVLDEICDQSDMLAVNASIQAAHGGEQGKAFAVVATEIRNLSERSASSAQEIADMITEVRDEMIRVRDVTDAGSAEVREGVGLATRAGEALHRIGESVGAVSDMMLEVGAAGEEQAAASRRVLATTERMRDLTGDVERGTGEQAAASQRVYQTMEQISTMAEQVSKAASQQDRQGRLIVEAVEDINRISGTNAKTVSRIVQVTEELELHSRELGRVAGFFSVEDETAETTAEPSS